MKEVQDRYIREAKPSANYGLFRIGTPEPGGLDEAVAIRDHIRVMYTDDLPVLLYRARSPCSVRRSARRSTSA